MLKKKKKERKERKEKEIHLSVNALWSLVQIQSEIEKVLNGEYLNYTQPYNAHNLFNHD